MSGEPMTRLGPRASLVGVALLATLTSMTVLADAVIVVTGAVVYLDENGKWLGAPGREVDLYTLRKRGPVIASNVTTEVGAFKFVATYDMQGERAFVVDVDG